MGDRVAVLDDGVLQQCDEPRALYDRPANAFVAGFTGSPAMNLPTAQLTERGALLGGYEVSLPRSTRTAAGEQGADSVLLGLRPESLRPADDGIPLVVELVEELGAEALCHGRIDSDEAADDEHRLVLRVDPRTPPKVGERIRATFDSSELHVFSALDGERLPD